MTRRRAGDFVILGSMRTYRSPRVMLVLLASGLFASGCTSIRYYSQAISGQLDILAHTRSIPELLDDAPAGDESPRSPAYRPSPEVRARLATILRMRNFATQVLGLPDNDSYRVFADLGPSPAGEPRSHVAWNVVATPEFSLQPKQWCFPIAGCVPYRGYFSQRQAQRFAQEMRDQGLDVRVAGVGAYSTLGWFRDPIFSTQLHRNDTEIAALIFHELAHQQLYLRGDTAFNESFATAVELEGVRRWLAQGNDPSALSQYQRDSTHHADFVELLLKYRKRLAGLYDSNLDTAAMRAAKAAVFAALRNDFAKLRQRWGGDSGYDRWFAQDLNNAHLASVGLYHQYVPAFQALLASAHGDLRNFYRLAKALAQQPSDERHARLASLELAGQQMPSIVVPDTAPEPGN